MLTSWNSIWSSKPILLGLLGFALLLVLGWAAPAQQKEPGDRGEAIQVRGGRSFVREGYTRPGNPQDGVSSKGQIKRMAFEVGYRGIGGTVYFAVLRLSGIEGDAWNTGLAGFDNSFIPGIDTDDATSSPPLDTRARYLYLYQVVNDRGVEPLPVRPISTTEIGTEPIASASIALTVDTRYITSWGHFTRGGFTIKAPDRKMNGEIVTIGQPGEEKDRELIVAVSANPSVVGKLPEQRFLLRSPAYRLHGWLSIGNPTAGLKETTSVAEFRKQKAANIKLAAWGEEMIRSTDAALIPDLVQLTYIDWVEPPEIQLGEEEPKQIRDKIPGRMSGKQLVLKADWLRKNNIHLSRHSVLFGFTSDLPPTDSRVLIKPPAAIAKGPAGAIRPVVDPGEGEGAADGIVPAAAGVVPAPTPTAVPTAAVVPAGIGPGLGIGGQAGAGQVGGGAAVPGFAGGGGSRGGGGGVTTGTGGGEGQAQQPQEQSTGTTSGITIINTNIQSQHQSQHQSNNCCPSPPGEVIPEPGAILLGLLGLPALVYLCRRRNSDKPTTE